MSIRIFAWPLLLFCLFACKQENGLKPPVPYFVAIIVEDLDTSLDWYTDKLGFEIIDQQATPTMGLRQANLQLDNALLELIEWEAALSLEEVVADSLRNAPSTGIFKIGFQVAAFDQWVEQLQNQGVRFRGEVVKNPLTGKRMLIILDPDSNRIQLFER